jgi:hypothetical protein
MRRRCGRPPTLAQGYNRKTGTCDPASPGGQIILAVGMGMTYQQACALCRIGRTAFFLWRARGGAYLNDPDAYPNDRRYADFVNEITRARAAGIAEALEAWRSAWATDWRAAAKWLAAVDPVYVESHAVRASGDAASLREVEAAASLDAVRKALADDSACALAAQALALAVQALALAVEANLSRQAVPTASPARRGDQVQAKTG